MDGRSGIQENAVGGVAARILFGGADRECGAIHDILHDIAATAADVDLVTSSELGAPIALLYPADAKALPIDAAIVTATWLSSSDAGAIAKILDADDGLCVVVAGTPDRPIDQMTSDRIVAVPDD